MTGEIHRQRRKAILLAHPEVAKLNGVEILTFPYCVAVFLVQVALLAYVGDNMQRAIWLGFTIGPFVALGALVAIHEISHDLVFLTPAWNHWLGIVTNMTILMPLSEIFRQHHKAHHNHLGDEKNDVDVPSAREINMVSNSTFRKLMWVVFNGLVLPLRSLMRLPVKTSKWLAFNWIACIGSGLVLLATVGPAPVIYLALSMLVSQGLHPANGRLVQRHMWHDEKKFESEMDRLMCPNTFSYYGSINAWTLNVGYHVEHHDFPHIPWTRLPQLRAMAPEWYARGHYTERGIWHMFHFITKRFMTLQQLSTLSESIEIVKPSASSTASPATSTKTTEPKLDAQNSPSTATLVKRTATKERTEPQRAQAPVVETVASRTVVSSASSACSVRPSLILATSPLPLAAAAAPATALVY
eukprot:Opistho-2@26857